MRDDDRMLDLRAPEFGSGVIGVCDICGERQAVIVLTKERFRLCVIDFLNKSWLKTERKPTSPAPVYRTERVVFETTAFGSPTSAPALAFSPTKVVRRPAVLVAPDTFGITTTVLDAAIRLAREGFEVLVPDVGKTDGLGPSFHLALRAGALGGGLPVRGAKTARLVRLYEDALRVLLGREMVDPGRAGVFGTSYGGSLALALAAESTQVRAAAVAYPIPLRPVEVARLVTAPTLVIGGARDRVARLAARQLREQLPSGTFLEVAGVRHRFLARDLRAYDLVRAEEAWTEIVRFLKEKLVPPAPRPPVAPVKFPAAAPPPPPAVAAAPAAPVPGPSA